MNVKTIIFSRDRAMQADATLQSFFLHCLDAKETVQVCIVYKATLARHAAQYERLATDYPLVKFVRQGNFRSDVIRLLDPYPGGRFSSRFYRLVSLLGMPGFRPGSRPDQLIRRFVDGPRRRIIRALLPRVVSSRGILFLVDDNLFVRDFSLQPALNALKEHGDALGFSLRLGRNTTHSYMAGQPQPPPDFLTLASGLLKFQWSDAPYDFGYPLEVSSSLYLESIIVPFLAALAFRNPNELEGAISSRADSFRGNRPTLLCFEQSVTFCNPVNVVQSIYSNRVGENIRYSTDDLLERFERGERVDVAAYNGFIPNGCHQEVQFFFKRQGEPG